MDTTVTNLQFSRAFKKMRHKLVVHGYRDQTITADYDRPAKKISSLLAKEGIAEFNSEICQWITDKVLDGDAYENIGAAKRHMIRCANMVAEYAVTGNFKFRYTETKRSHIAIPPQFAPEIKQYLEWERASRRLHEKTLKNIQTALIQFTALLQDRYPHEPWSNLDRQKIFCWVESLSFRGPSDIRHRLSNVKKFLQYLFHQGSITEDLSCCLPKVRNKDSAELPTVYTEQEINQLLGSIDRANAKGKRDFAMMLLAVRLGLRSSDIIGLTFSNIHWDRNCLLLTQQKTHIPLELPLTSEIGEALIDYLKFSRPVVKDAVVFRTLTPPYGPMAGTTFFSAVTAHFQKAKIQITGKKHGPHALRFSLTSRLLEQKIPLPVITEILGHAHSDTTMGYTKIDVGFLRLCALEVSSCSYFTGGE